MVDPAHAGEITSLGNALMPPERAGVGDPEEGNLSVSDCTAGPPDKQQSLEGRILHSTIT